MDPQLKRAFKRALRCYRFGNENTNHNCIRNRIETGLPGDTEMKVWTATITKKSNSILAGNLSKGLNAKSVVFSAVLASPAVSSKLDVHSVILKKEFYWQIKNCGHVLRVTSKVTS